MTVLTKTEVPLLENGQKCARQISKATDQVYLDLRGRETMFSAGPGGAWSQEASHARAAESGRTASDAVRPYTTNEELALRKRSERSNTTKLMARLELLAPKVHKNTQQGGRRSKALRGRAKEELLIDVMHAVRLAQVLRSDDLLLDESE